MKPVWRRLALVLITLLGAGLLADATTVAQAPAITPIPPVPQPAGSIKVTFWFGLTGSLGNVVQQVVNKYNSSQTLYYIEAVQQPDYDATIQKLNTSLAGGALPNVVQIYDIGTQRMIDTKKIVPVQDLIDKEKLDILSDLEPAVARYTTFVGRLNPLHLITSRQLCFLIKKPSKKAALTLKNESGRTTRSLMPPRS